jgi:YopX protein
MERENKYRAWDVLRQEWGYFHVQDLAAGLFSKSVFENWCQFTGLKDRYGKEIYEGDIVNWDEEYFEDIGWKRSISTISFDNGAFKVGPTVLGEWAHPSQVEVIGNIYDNPDLLNKAQPQLA